MRTVTIDWHPEEQGWLFARAWTAWLFVLWLGL